jgi:branched-chain amino acid transport system substrate-binding protein
MTVSGKLPDPSNNLRRKKMKKAVIPSLIAALLFQSMVYAQDTIKIGVDTPLTGAGATPGQYLLWGVLIAVDEVNAGGGILGKKIELLVMDDETDPQKAVANINEFVKKKVAAVLGPVNSGNAAAFIPILQKERIPNMLVIASAAKLTKHFENEEKNYIFRSSPSDSGQIQMLVRWAAEKYKKIGLANDTSGYGRFGRETILENLKEHHLAPVEMTEFQLGDITMSSQLEMLRKAGAEAVAVVSLGAEIANLVKTADKIGYHPIFFGPWTFFHYELSRIPTNLSDGLVGVLAATANDSEKAKEIDRILRDKYLQADYYPFTFVAVSYEGTMLMLDAIKRAGSTDGEKIRDALEDTEKFQGISKVFIKPFSKTDHELYNADDMFLAVWKDGKVVRLENKP